MGRQAPRRHYRIAADEFTKAARQRQRGRQFAWEFAMRTLRRTIAQFFLISSLGVASLAGCGRGPQDVVVYTALDQDFSAPIFDEFTRETGIIVRPKFDTEST